MPEARPSRLRSARDLFGPVLANEFVCRIPSQAIRDLFYRVLGVTIGQGAVIMGHTEVIAPDRIRVGAGSIIGRHCLLDGRGGLTIGANVNVSSYALLVTGDHDLRDPSYPAFYKPIVLEDYAWVATRALIMPGVTVGRGAVVAAGALVTANVPPLAIWAGVPARKIGERPGDPAYEQRLFQPMW